MKKLAVIGTGIAGMSAAYFLKDDYDITVFEKNEYVGGHTNTIDVFDGEKSCPVDTGFMVFNQETYPLLIKLFEELGVVYKDTDMSFTVRNHEENLEFNGCSLDGVFSQRKNIFNLKFLKMIRDIMKFNNKAHSLLDESGELNLTIFDFVKKLDLGEYFYRNYLVPMGAAIWSTPFDQMKEFPAKSLVRFFVNHGLAGVTTQLQWKTVVGGSRQYRDLLIKEFEDQIQVSSEIKGIEQLQDKVKVVFEGGKEEIFDKVVVAGHGDQAYQMLINPSPLQKSVLSKFKYQKNIATVHTDPSVMPNLKKNWSSWNFLMKENETYTVYYMNRLQEVSSNMDIFISINGEKFIDKNKVIKTIEYEHPIFDMDAINAQEMIDEMNLERNVHFCGSYYRYGFHEDALLSSVNLCRSILGREVL